MSTLGTLLATACLWAVDGLLNNSPAVRVTTWSVSLVLFSVVAFTVAGSREGRGYGFSALRVGAWLPVWCGLGFGLTSLAWRQPSPTMNPDITQTGVVTALIILHVALAGWVAGYLVGPGRTATRVAIKFADIMAPRNTYILRTSNVPWILFFVGLLGRVLQMRSGHFGYVGDASQLLSSPAGSGRFVGAMIDCGSVAIVVAAISYARTPTKSRKITLFTIVAAQVVLGGLAAHKQEFLVCLLAPAIVLGAAGKLPWKSLAIGLVVFLTIVTPYISSYRETVRSSDRTLTVSDGITSAPGVFRDALDRPFGERFEESMTAMTHRLREIDSVALVAQSTPAVHEFKSPAEYLTAPIVGVVPRAIWQSKPVLDSGSQFAMKYLGVGNKQYTSAAVPPAADLYLHGGFLTVLAGMFGIGAFSRLVDRTLHPVLDLRYAVVFLPLFLTLTKSEVDVTTMIASLPGQLLLGLVLCRLSFRSSPDACRAITPSSSPPPAKVAIARSSTGSANISPTGRVRFRPTDSHAAPTGTDGKTEKTNAIAPQGAS